jgi:alkylhydroperoxidase/carboxymuconolactone decarboxylase family protein YurZ
MQLAADGFSVRGRERRRGGRARRRVRIVTPIGACLLAATAATGAEPERAAAPVRSIEEGAEDFLRRNPAPREIEADWNRWATESGKLVWDRPGLTRAERSMITIAVLSVLGEEGPLRVHVEAGLANGLTRAQIAETIMHTAVYGGVPRALGGMSAARAVFDRLDAEAAETAESP